MKTSSNLSRRLIVTLAGLALAAVCAMSYTFVLSNNTGLPIKWPAGNIPLRIMLGDSQTLSDGANFNTSARAAADAWNSFLGAARFQAELVPAGTPAQQSGNQPPQNPVNELAFSNKVFGQDFEEGTLAVTTGFSQGNERIEADIIFNTAYTWDSYRGNARFQGSTITPDIRRVALHELGHVLGLDHPDEATPKQELTAIMNSRIGNLDSLVSDDTDGAQQLYGPTGVPANDNFANATVITLTQGNSTSLKGYNTNATREANEPLNANNAGGRSVWWRWTAPSSGSVTLSTGKVDSTTKKIDLSGGKSSYYDTTLGVYTGATIGALTQIATDDDIEDGVIQITELIFNVTAGTTYHFSVDGFNNDDGNGADNGGITLNLAFTSVGGELPVITSQPASVTVNSGGSVSFSVTATGTPPLAYQWQLGGTAIAGATNASYSIASASATQAGTYTVVVSNAAGSVQSNGATLTVNTPPPPAPPPSSGGGGGGGAPSWWFLVAMIALGSMRRFFRR